jgi:ABC-type sugar transport system ATPase subunit
MFVKNSELHLPTPRPNLSRAFLVGIRPEDVHLDPDGPFSGRVILTEPLGVETILHIQTGQETIISLVAGMTSVQVGDTIRFSIAGERLHLFDMNGRRI